MVEDAAVNNDAKSPATDTDIVRDLRDFGEMGLEGGAADPLIDVMHSVATQAADEIDRLREDCAEAYQAVGFLANCLGYWEMAADDPRQAQITKLMDNLSAAAESDERPHADLLPFGWQV